MPTPQGYVLSHEDIRIIRELYFRFGRLQHYTNSFGRPPEDSLDHEEFHTTEFHIAHTPEGGIPALTQVTATLGVGDIPGSADCQVFRFNPKGAPEDEAEEITGHILKVYNLSTVPVEGNTWITITRDKYGDWIVSGEATTGVTCFPAELVTTYDECIGYEAKRMNIRDDGGYDEHLSGFRTTYVYTPDEDKTLQPLTRGWLCPSPDNAIDTGTGTCVGGTGTADDNQRWIFIPVLKWRTTCEDDELKWQYSTDGGITWIDEEILGVDCGTGTSGSDPQAITVGGCGWISGLRPENCLELLVVETIGRCLCINDQQEFVLCWNGQEWESGFCTSGTGDDNFLFCGTGTTDEEGVVLFWIDSGGTPRLSINGENLVWDKCGVEDATGDLFIDFSGGSVEFCGTASITECDPSYFTVRIKCTLCPTQWYCVVEEDGDCNGTGTGDTITILPLTFGEAILLGDLICAGPFDTELEAELACAVNCEQATSLPDNVSSDEIVVPPNEGTAYAIYWFRLGTGLLTGDGATNYFIRLLHDVLPDPDTLQIDGIGWWYYDDTCQSRDNIISICSCNNAPGCCEDAANSGFMPEADGYLYAEILVLNNTGVNFTFTVTLGQGDC